MVSSVDACEKPAADAMATTLRQARLVSSTCDLDDQQLLHT
jgi:hypothetical protein